MIIADGYVYFRSCYIFEKSTMCMATGTYKNKRSGPHNVFRVIGAKSGVGIWIHTTSD